MTKRLVRIWMLAASIATAVPGCEEEDGGVCPMPPYTCSTSGACLHAGGTALNSYTCPEENHVCCDVP